jgi:hypothetical protein
MFMTKLAMAEEVRKTVSGKRIVLRRRFSASCVHKARLLSV